MATKLKKYKLKVHKGAKKRMKITKSGQIKRHKAGAGHLLSAKSGKRRRQLRKPSLVHHTVLRTYLEHLGG